jgi:hypothetical protein
MLGIVFQILTMMDNGAGDDEIDLFYSMVCLTGWCLHVGLLWPTASRTVPEVGRGCPDTEV